MIKSISTNMLEYLYDGLYIIDNDKKIIYWNRSAEQITGYSSSEVIGKKYCCNVLRHVDINGNGLCDTSCPLAETLMDGDVREASVFLQHKAGHRIPVSIRVVPLRNNRGKVVGAAEIFFDNSKHEELSKEIQELSDLAMIDNLTGLRNRRFAKGFLEGKLNEVRNSGESFGVMFFDIDHFKYVNDKYGHDFGDKILQMVSNTLKFGLRSTDIVVRWGGEEIIAIVSGKMHKEKLAYLSDKLRLLVENSRIEYEDDEFVSVTVSVGATLALADDSVDSLVKRVDQLMYKSKANGRNCVTIE
ncbi:sensor domain-containing diguanylate cyclase [Dendrosporobacter sp. 1207_IL3150]|uniref:sensor domain-containing diguanylate cyclase n=1 Tax=Dendrosporobacter sp. 1207_IL3150 TaxID=3084054 RepID=UPI002FD96648